MVLDIWFTSLQTYSLIDSELCKLFTHLSVKEDSHTLYGFFDQNERHLFRNLISVSGVGPSTAQIILSTYNTDEIISYIHQQMLQQFNMSKELVQKQHRESLLI